MCAAHDVLDVLASAHHDLEYGEALLASDLVRDKLKKLVTLLRDHWTCSVLPRKYKYSIYIDSVSVHPECLIEQFWANIEANKLQAKTEAKIIWQNILRKHEKSAKFQMNLNQIK